MSNEQAALSPLQKIEQVVRQAIAKVMPGQSGNFGTTVYGRILKVNRPGGAVDNRSKGFSVDVQVLLPDLAPDPNLEPILDVPIDPVVFGNKTAVLGLPLVDMVVRVGFMYRDPSYPYIQGITAEQDSFPSAVLAETLVELILRHTHLGAGPGAPTSNIQATVPPGGPVLPADLQRT